MKVEDLETKLNEALKGRQCEKKLKMSVRKLEEDKRSMAQTVLELKA
jgi:hypothetical protein